MRYVKYVGLSHQRIITARDWQTVGENADTVVWNAQNGFAVPADVFTDEQLRKAIEPDQGFVITGGDEDFTPRPQAMDMTPAQAAQNAEAPVNVPDVLEGRQNVSRDDSGAAVVVPDNTTGGHAGNKGNGSPR